AGPPPAESAAAPTTGGPETGPPAPPGGDGPANTWREAVRLERWSEAATLIDALPDDARARPDMRYVRARAAVGTGDGARAIALLDGLETALPLLGADVARWRAEAQLVAG